MGKTSPLVQRKQVALIKRGFTKNHRTQEHRRPKANPKHTPSGQIRFPAGWACLGGGGRGGAVLPSAAARRSSPSRKLQSLSRQEEEQACRRRLASSALRKGKGLVMEDGPLSLWRRGS